MPTPAWPVVLFDLDGTLADTVPLILASYRHALGTVLGDDAVPDEPVLRSFIGRQLAATFREVDAQRADELVAAYMEWNLANSQRYIRSFPGVPELLAELAPAGARTGIVTSKRRSSAELALRLGGLDGVVPVLAAMEDTSVHKPDPAPLRHALALLGVDPGSAVYVGDAVVDIECARAAGVASIAVTWGAAGQAQLVQAGPGAVVSQVAELRELLLR